MPDHECDQGHRLLTIEAEQNRHANRIAEVESGLNAGRVLFAEIKKDLAAIQLALAELKVQIAAKPSEWQQKAIDAIIFWAVPLVGGSILFSIVKSGQVPGINP